MEETILTFFKKEFEKLDGCLFRTKIYANTYLVFTLLVSAIAVVGLVEFLDLNKTANNQYVLGFVKPASGLALFTYISYQMLTIRSKYATHIFISVVAVFAALLGYAAVMA